MQITNEGLCVTNEGADDRIEVVISCEHPSIDLYLVIRRWEGKEGRGSEDTSAYIKQVQLFQLLSRKITTSCQSMKF
jgi:hypothetical protein